jgi:AcrR family transcriptional regulator
MHIAERPLRRRGDVLVDAIRAAVVDELAAVGYDALSIEHVADRAQTGKASIYRRWPNKLELVLDAIDAQLPMVGSVPDTGSLRDDILTVLRRIARHMNSRAGGAMRACVTEAKHHSELSGAVRERLVEPRKRVMLEVLRQGVDRGEVRPDAVTDRVVELGPMLMYAERQSRATALRDTDVVAIVDEILLPLIRR